MAINKVIYGGKVLIDLTGDTITANKVLSGYTAHDKSGAPITGRAHNRHIAIFVECGVPRGQYPEGH